MAAASKPLLRQYKSLPVLIEEDHNDVVPHIHRAIASRHLPMSGITMVHFDSHPDLLLPLHMHADDVFDKEKLYSGQSIENWILPLVYAGHISEIYWLKPPWADQLPDASALTFSVGKWKQTNELRMTLDHPYFLTEALYVPESQLTDAQSVTLHVITIKPNTWTDCSISDNCSNCSRQSAKSFSATEFTSEYVQAGDRSSNAIETHTVEKQCQQTDPPRAKRTKLEIESVADTQGNEDLTDASKAGKSDTVQSNCIETCPELNNKTSGVAISNASKATNCSENRCDKQVEPYQSTTGSGDSSTSNELAVDQRWLVELGEKLKGKPFILDIDLDFFSTKDPFRNECSPELTKLLQELFEFKLPMDKSEKSVFEFSQARLTQLDELNTVFQQLQQQPDCSPRVENSHRQSLLNSLVSLLKSDECQSTLVDYEMLYRAGCTFDGTSLPHHISSQQQIQQLMSHTASILKSLPKPTLITVARSSLDDYCPQDQVDTIQESMLQVFTDVYEATDVQKLYAEQQCD